MKLLFSTEIPSLLECCGCRIQVVALEICERPDPQPSFLREQPGTRCTLPLQGKEARFLPKKMQQSEGRGIDAFEIIGIFQCLIYAYCSGRIDLPVNLVSERRHLPNLSFFHTGDEISSPGSEPVGWWPLVPHTSKSGSFNIM